MCVSLDGGHGDMWWWKMLLDQGSDVCTYECFLRYHLQALRHLCVLAAEPRLLVPVDVDTLKPCYAMLDVTYKVCLLPPTVKN